MEMWSACLERATSWDRPLETDEEAEIEPDSLGDVTIGDMGGDCGVVAETALGDLEEVGVEVTEAEEVETLSRSRPCCSECWCGGGGGDNGDEGVSSVRAMGMLAKALRKEGGGVWVGEGCDCGPEVGDIMDWASAVEPPRRWWATGFEEEEWDGVRLWEKGLEEDRECAPLDPAGEVVAA